MTDFKAKMHQIRFRLGLRPRPRWGSLQRSLRPPSWIWGPTSKEREREGREGRGREEREGEGKERAMSPPLFGGSLRLCLQLNLPTPLYLSKMLFTDVQLLLYSKKKTTTTTKKTASYLSKKMKRFLSWLRRYCHCQFVTTAARSVHAFARSLTCTKTLKLNANAQASPVQYWKREDKRDVPWIRHFHRALSSSTGDVMQFWVTWGSPCGRIAS